MQNIKLSKRLAAIASLLPPEGGLADVGTDHAYIPLWLLENGFEGYLAATDINPLPLRRAEKTASGRGLSGRVDFYLCDGLSALDPAKISAVVIAGMGGENIAAILAAAPWTRDKLLILQPMSKSDRLRLWLFENSYRPLSETLVEDGAVYEILKVTGGGDLPYREAELLTGHFELISSSPLFPARLDFLMEKTRRAIRGLADAKQTGEIARRESLRRELDGLSRMKNAVKK